jgi:ribose transport system permease protein
MSDEMRQPPPMTAPGESLAERLTLRRRTTVGGVTNALRDYVIVLSVAVICIVLTFSSDVFLTSTNLLNVVEQSAPVGIIAIALTYVLITGEFDISAGAISALTGVIAAKLANSIGPWEGILLAIVAATGIGLLNGLLIAYGGINSFVCTLAVGLRVPVRGWA